MYFLTALACALVSGLLWFLFRKRTKLHLEILTITFGAATLMWLVDVIYTAAEGEAPLTFTPLDGQIALFTVLGGLFLWLLVAFILNHREKKTA